MNDTNSYPTSDTIAAYIKQINKFKQNPDIPLKAPSWLSQQILTYELRRLIHPHCVIKMEAGLTYGHILVSELYDYSLI